LRTTGSLTWTWLLGCVPHVPGCTHGTRLD